MAGKYKKIAGEILTDPGIGYCLIDAILFAGVSVTGSTVCVAAATLCAGVKTLKNLQPGFLKETSWLKKTVQDVRTSLYISGVALTGVACAIGLEGLTAPTLPAAGLGAGIVFPFICSLCYATGDFCVAGTLSRAEKKTAMKTISNPKLGDILKKSLRMPETFMLAGALGAGLMAGGEALLALPIVGTAHAVAVRNIMQNKPEHNGHPKLIAAVSATLFAGIGVASGNLFVSLAHLIGAGVLVSIECRITPGGASAIMDDIKNGLQKIWGQATPPQDILVPAYGAKPLMALQPLNMRLRPHFSAYNKGAQIAMKHKRRHIRTLSRLRPQVARCRIIYRLKIR